MHSTDPRPYRPPVHPPPQAAPVDRAGPAPPGPVGHAAVAASATDCSRLPGFAQQMCYATRYGVAV